MMIIRMMRISQGKTYKYREEIRRRNWNEEGKANNQEEKQENKEQRREQKGGTEIGRGEEEAYIRNENEEGEEKERKY